ncbi:MAG TPA: NUDIX domain-containing protein [Polyangiaceae bacterium]|nr:NUDIX domain-containing protein [Polyangiaceae bacterium]
MDRIEPLRRLLIEHRPALPNEQAFAVRMRALVTGSAAPLSRHQFEPGHFTASAFVLSPDARSLLLIHHKKLGLWLQPGGHLEPADPDAPSAARREVAEEVGLDDLDLLVDGLFDIDIHQIPAYGAEPAHEHFDLRFLFKARSLAHRAGSDVLGARWVRLQDVARIQSDESVLRAVRKLC